MQPALAFKLSKNFGMVTPSCKKEFFLLTTTLDENS